MGWASVPPTTLPFSTVSSVSTVPVKPSAGTSLAAPLSVTPREPVAASSVRTVTFSAAASTPCAPLIASTTAVEVTVAPVRASTPSPRVSGMDLPTNWSVKSTPSQFWPMPGVCVEASTVRVAMLALSSRVTFTFTGASPKPFALPSRVAPGLTGDSGWALLMASTTAPEVRVAPVRASTPSPRVSGMDLPTN